MNDPNPIPVRTRNIQQQKTIDATETTPEAEQKLIAFCEEQVQKMSRYARLNNDDGQVGFYELNKALGEYQNINLALISIYNLAKIEYTKAKEAFEDWFAEKYIEQRELLNPRTLAANKWLSQREIEMNVRHNNRTEYRKYNDEMVYAEQKVALLRRLLESWASHAYTLSQLSKNAIAEVGGAMMTET